MKIRPMIRLGEGPRRSEKNIEPLAGTAAGSERTHVRCYSGLTRSAIPPLARPENFSESNSHFGADSKLDW